MSMDIFTTPKKLANAAVLAEVNLSPMRFGTKAPISHLHLDVKQQKFIQNLYSRSNEYRNTFGQTDQAQNRAKTFLASHKLDPGSLEQLESRWSKTWATKWSKSDTSTKIRVVYQCTCGYDTNARRLRESKSKDNWDRRAAYDFTGCCAHADVTYYGDTSKSKIERIVGYFEHDPACRDAELVRHPPVPIHEHVYEVAVAQLSQGASVATIQSTNQRMLEQKLYRGQLNLDPNLANFRYELLQGDFSRLYRRRYQSEGIDVAAAAETNVDKWLTSGNPKFEKIREAVLHYSARENKTEHFEICISTPEMTDAAWKYVHNQQLILDGTFGLSTARLLLWIAMGVDENNHGIPVAMFLFSAPTGTKATHAGYDTKIITKLLEAWKKALGTRNGQTFAPKVAITDTDTKERGALVKVWSGLLGKLDNNFATSQVVNRLRSLEELLLLSTERDAALLAIAGERNFFQSLCTQDISSRAGEAGLKYLNYFESTWMSTEIWESWSEKGRKDAAHVLGVDIGMVLTTTNHLESFNGVLKRKHIAQWQHSGQRLRFDVLIHRFILRVLPSIFGNRRIVDGLQLWKANRFFTAAGGRAIVPQTTKNLQPMSDKPITWWGPDAAKDGAAQDFLKLGRVIPIQSGREYETWASCAATSADMRNPAYPRYWLTMHPSGSATCTCLDWLTRGGACKHLRSLRLLIESWISLGFLPHKYHYPLSRLEALEISEKNRLWYGDQYFMAITPPVSESTGAAHSPPAVLTITPDTTLITLPVDLDSATLSLEQDINLETEMEVFEAVDLCRDTDRCATEFNVANTRAIETQVQQRYQHYFAQSLPNLHGIVNLLDDCLPSKDSENFQDFILTIGTLYNRLVLPSMGMGPAVLPGTIQNRSQARETSPSPMSKRLPSTGEKRRMLLPPSPEGKKEKRKKSYSTI